MIDLEWVAEDTRKISKTCVIAYAPDVGNKDDKVAYSSHLAGFKAGLEKQVSDARTVNSFEDLNQKAIQHWFKE